MVAKVTLNRTLSLPMMVLYGLGTTIGAGIYALVGEIALVSGYFSLFLFLLLLCWQASRRYHLPSYVVVIPTLPALLFT